MSKLSRRQLDALVASSCLVVFVVSVGGSAGCSAGSSASPARTSPPTRAPASSSSSSSASSSSSSSPSGPAGAAGAPATSPQPAAGLTRWPIVLAHGANGLNGPGRTTYFDATADHLRALGADVLVTDVPSIHTIEHRAGLLDDQIRAAWPDPAVKVNLIAHSTGGLDARWAISHLGLGDRVASLSCVSTPHRGTALADIVVGVVPGFVQDAIDVLMNQVGWDWNMVTDLTTVHMNGTFNPATPDDPRILYQSWAGIAEPGRRTGHGRISPVLAPGWAILLAIQGPNDGVIAESSARWGLWRGTIPADHMEEVGQVAGSAFDDERFYESIVRELAARGH